MVNKVKIKDKGWNKLKKKMVKFKDKVASVGIQGKKAEEDHDGVTNVMLGAVHEFGAPSRNIPQRSWLRSTESENRKKYDKLIAEAVGNSIDGNRFEGELFLVGETFRFDILKKIKSRIPPPLKEETIKRRKGDNVPLWDTGQLKDAITAVVRDKK